MDKRLPPDKQVQVEALAQGRREQANRHHSAQQFGIVQSVSSHSVGAVGPAIIAPVASTAV